ncbi:MAG: 1-(5-phosphoribosyl)-5-[(5-phosphoribosylamino)methylideneamino]imidazole-4-carboxamide isomerase [Candidatus Omnitrophica bacterium]|nr:1-(5-phosphoribosyl)-5-[(5-phosphoribosylamino)methylideneamino]imidazole-4-carboxamide isomerase [Candidatus Omnitrophota bacterium]
MIVIPAIDLKQGRVVRLRQGDFAAETVYASQPRDIADTFSGKGATRIHLVDLDGAREGKPTHLNCVKEIVENVSARFQIGGGIRTPEAIDRYLKIGIHRVVLGTRACLDEVFLKESLDAFGERVIVGVDAHHGMIATDAWTRITEIPAIRIIERVAMLGGKEIIFTDIKTDGMMRGPNFEQIQSALGLPGLNIIASGGVSGIADIRRFLEMRSERLSGVIVGKALYEGSLDLAEALRICAEGPSAE